MSWTQVSYLYDGSYAGFLTCVFESYVHREEPAGFTRFDEAAASFYPQRAVETDPAHARRVYRALTSWGRQAAGGPSAAFSPVCRNGNSGSGGFISWAFGRNTRSVVT